MQKRIVERMHVHESPWEATGTVRAPAGQVDADGLRDRTKRFAFDIIDLVKDLPRGVATDAIARQLVRSGPGICANHRAAGRARSSREFVARLAVALEEADETELWLEALLACRLAPDALVQLRLREARELRAILYASIRTARKRAGRL